MLSIKAVLEITQRQVDEVRYAISEELNVIIRAYQARDVGDA